MRSARESITRSLLGMNRKYSSTCFLSSLLFIVIYAWPSLREPFLPQTEAIALKQRKCTTSSPSDDRSWPINQVDPREHEGYCKEEVDVCPSIFLPLQRIYSDLKRQNRMSNFVVNIGANDGKAADPLYPVLMRFPDINYVGFEPSSLIDSLRENLQPFKNAVAEHEAITPSNVKQQVAKYMSTHGVSSAPDIIKIDTDGCDCHILSSLMVDPLMHSKVIQIELNHVLPPPISYMDMCESDVYGRSSNSNLDVWGCSMQAAYDIVRPHGYVLLQYDWPDAVFIHSAFLPAFPCLTAAGEDFFHRNYWTGFFHAKENYSRFHQHVTNSTFVQSIELLALRAHLHPRSTLENIISTQQASWNKVPLWIELSVSGSTVSAQIRRPVGETLHVMWGR